MAASEKRANIAVACAAQPSVILLRDIQEKMLESVRAFFFFTGDFMHDRAMRPTADGSHRRAKQLITRI